MLSLRSSYYKINIKPRLALKKQNKTKNTHPDWPCNSAQDMLHLCPENSPPVHASWNTENLIRRWQITTQAHPLLSHFWEVSCIFFFFYTETLMTRKCFVYDLYTLLEARVEEQGYSSQQDAIWAWGTSRLRPKVLSMTLVFLNFFLLRHQDRQQRDSITPRLHDCNKRLH